MKNDSEKKDLHAISHRAMKAQMTSFRLEGIDISKERAEQIRREVVDELKNGAAAKNGS